MAKYEMDLPQELIIERRDGAKVTCNVENLNDDIIAKLAMHGLRQKISDAAASAKKQADEDGGDVAEIASAMMQKVVDNLEKGDWGVERGEGASADPLDKYRVKVLRQLMAANPDGELKKKYDEVPSDDQAGRRKLLLDVAAKNADKIDPQAEAMRVAEQEAKRAAKEAASGLDI